MKILLKIIDLLTDSDLRAQCAKAGMKRAEEFSLDCMLDNYESMFQIMVRGT